MKEHKKLYKAGKLWITATLFSLVGIALATTNVSADTVNQSNTDQQLSVTNNNTTNLANWAQTEYQDSDTISQLQNQVDNAQQKVNQAQQDVNTAQSNVDNQQNIVNADQSNLQSAQNAYQAAGGQQSTVKQSISLSSDWLNAVKSNLASSSDGIQDVDPNSTFGQELSNYGSSLLNQNSYISDPALQKISVNVNSNGALDDQTELEITRYTISLLNPLRSAIGVDQYQITQQSLDDSTNIASQYSAANWTLFNHGSHDFEVLFNNHQDGESLSDGYLSFNYGPLTLDDIHRGIYNSIIDMLFADGNSNWGHMTDLAGLRGDMNGIYLGVQVDKNGQVHFNGNTVKIPGAQYATQIDSAGNMRWYTAQADTSPRIPITAEESSDTEQLRQAVTDAQSQLDQDTDTLNNYKQTLADANTQLQQAQQELQQAQQDLANAQQPITGWETENGNKYYRDSNGNRVDGWQYIDNQWYYFNNQVLVTNQITYVPGNYAMQSGYYDFDANGHYAVNTLVMGDTNGNWYDFGNDGYALTGLQQWGSNWYYFDPNYAYALTGWQTIGSNRYYFDPTDKYAYTGLHSDIDQYTYYFDPTTAAAQTGFINVNGDLYDFGDDYTAQSGLQYHNDSTYYFSPNDYKAVSGIYSIGDQLFYFDPNSHIEMSNIWQEIDGHYYYFNPAAVNGLQNINGYVYYFQNHQRVENQTLTLDSENGIEGGTYSFDRNGIGILQLAQTGWETDNGDKYYRDSNGNLVSGWQNIDGNEYYFDPFTKIADTGLQTIDGNQYYFDISTCIEQTGWKKIDGATYYFTPVAAKGLTYINDQLYYFHPIFGTEETGWKKINEHWYFFDNYNANALTYWQKINDNWYYFDHNNANALTGWQKIDGSWYYFDLNNANALTDWQKINDNWYYFDHNNANALTGWQKIDGSWYYFDPTNANALNGLQKIGGTTYYFINNKMIANQTLVVPDSNGIKGGHYSFDKNGVGILLPDGWQKDKDGHWMYQKNSKYLTNWQKINGNWYFFDASAKALTGWQRINGNWYYFDLTNANALTDWQKINDNWYYFDHNNANALTGWRDLNGAWYYFDLNNANALTGWQRINGNWYYFNLSNAMAVNGLQKINGSIFYFWNNKMVVNQALTLPSSNGIKAGHYSFDESGHGILQ